MSPRVVPTPGVPEPEPQPQPQPEPEPEPEPAPQLEEPERPSPTWTCAACLAYNTTPSAFQCDVCGVADGVRRRLAGRWERWCAGEAERGRWAVEEAQRARLAHFFTPDPAAATATAAGGTGIVAPHRCRVARDRATVEAAFEALAERREALQAAAAAAAEEEARRAAAAAAAEEEEAAARRGGLGREDSGGGDGLSEELQQLLQLGEPAPRGGGVVGDDGSGEQLLPGSPQGGPPPPQQQEEDAGRAAPVAPAEPPPPPPKAWGEASQSHCGQEGTLVRVDGADLSVLLRFPSWGGAGRGGASAGSELWYPLEVVASLRRAEVELGEAERAELARQRRMAAYHLLRNISISMRTGILS
jgi:hypothetical protein